ncbi:hypothetical protein T492DRAFT_497319 [Pavlovales sp. CCMP2436]|nr:hypothetical protein T492DRAFT_497319 [Pavlovales sp. CCMP2436]
MKLAFLSISTSGLLRCLPGTLLPAQAGTRESSHKLRAARSLGEPCADERLDRRAGAVLGVGAEQLVVGHAGRDADGEADGSVERDYEHFDLRACDDAEDLVVNRRHRELCVVNVGRVCQGSERDVCPLGGEDGADGRGHACDRETLPPVL